MRFFQSLMPKDHQFVDSFTAHSKQVVHGAEAFRAMLSEPGQMHAHYVELCRFEEEADRITRDTILAIHRTFITPFDRGQILELITGLDDTIDLMKEGGRRMLHYGVPFTPEMLGMADCAVHASIAIRDGMPLLEKIGSNVERLTAMHTEISKWETEADDLLDLGLKRLFEQNVSPGYKLTVEKVYDIIESIVDRCEDVSDIIQGIVIEQV